MVPFWSKLSENFQVLKFQVEFRQKMDDIKIVQSDSFQIL